MVLCLSFSPVTVWQPAQGVHPTSRPAPAFLMILIDGQYRRWMFVLQVDSVRDTMHLAI